MSKIYKIRHIPTGKFVRIKLEKQGIKIWKAKGVLEKIVPEMGNQLFDTHKGWKTPPNPTNDDFNEINCEIVVYEIKETEL